MLYTRYSIAVLHVYEKQPNDNVVIMHGQLLLAQRVQVTAVAVKSGCHTHSPLDLGIGFQLACV